MSAIASFSKIAAEFSKAHSNTSDTSVNTNMNDIQQPTFIIPKSPNEMRTRSHAKFLPSVIAPLSHLPKPTGKYNVGCHDVEWSPNSDYDNDSGVGISSQDGMDDEDGILLRMYYPAELTKSTKRTHPSWIPSHEYGMAFGKFVRWPQWLTLAVSAGLVAHPTSAYLDTQLIAGETKLPVVIFSHGLGGSRTIYSAFCSEMASHGFVVCAMEHRDGSAALASLNNGSRYMLYQQASTTDLETQKPFRRAQLKTRVGEINMCLQFLKSLNEGKELSTKGEIDLSKFQSRLDMSNLVMAGHSFGAATSVQLLREPDTPFKCGVLLDAWAQPLQYDKKPLQRPVLLHCSDQFAQWPENFALLKKLAHEANSSVSKEMGRSFMISVKGSAHQNYTDFVMIFSKYSHFIRRYAGTIDPRRAMDLLCRGSLEFMRQSLTDVAVTIPGDATIFSDKRPSEVVLQA
ncbi:platelet-activating factor acetylhydrolase [Endogone sp. FLAS-F59071]|nr:platelet-activating factor acetylhydrolase [Endogone sp. FLAS-F59071]|eukprot:RUS14486.1 platelet-activating factor acetylhydrolase [Endogone sp. FLAS-F59071]